MFIGALKFTLSRISRRISGKLIKLTLNELSPAKDMVVLECALYKWAY